MPRGNRIHRLPQRLDYALIPAPLDLSLTDVSEKSSLPSIIVTPSSPSAATAPEAGYFLAFLAPPPQPTFRARLASRLRSWLPARLASKEQAVQLPSSPGEHAVSLRKEQEAVVCVPSALHFRARTTVLLVLLLFILACHLLTHRLAARRPALDFFSAPHTSVSAAAAASTSSVDAGVDVDVAALPSDHGDAGAWWDVAWLWEAPPQRPHGADAKRDFIVEAFPGMSVHGA